jgi:hypothetical protein
MCVASHTRTKDPLLEETASFTGEILYYSLVVSRLIIGAVHDGKTAIAGDGQSRPLE